MGGMKSGSGDDLFADDAADDQDDMVDDDRGAETDGAAGDGPLVTALNTASDKTPTSSPSENTSDVLPGASDHSGNDEHQLPWIHRRDGVKEDRSHETIHYTEHTLKRERREMVGAIEDELGDDIELTDAREAAYLVGMDHVGEVADLLRKWGYAIE